MATYGKGSQLAPQSSDSGNQNAKKRSKGKTINLDDGNNVGTAKCIVFDKEEDERLVSKILSLTFALIVGSLFVPSQIYELRTNHVC
jgi:hypothetical protein